MAGPPEDVKQVLEGVFGVRHAGFRALSPAKVDADRAAEVASLLPYDDVVRQSAVLAAQAVAAGLESVGLRPADYGEMEQLPGIVANKLSKAIRANSDEFVVAFVRQLSMRG